MTTTPMSLDLARGMSLDKLAAIGRYNLRLVAEYLGLLAVEQDKTDFFRKSSDEQALFLYRKMHEGPKALVDPVESRDEVQELEDHSG